MIWHYLGIDTARFIASLFVVMIHIDPFIEPLNFVMTRIFGRLAVPFFMMTTGYFLYRREPEGRWLKTVLHLLKLYAFATLLYFPLMIYSGQLSSPGMFLQDLFWNGTFYHLWYFPAMIIGLVIVEGLRRYAPEKLAWFVVILLYLIGLGGDSYGQWFISTPFYAGLGSWMAYTRNGLFFAPLMIMLGAHASKCCLKPLGMLLLFGLYSGEMMLIHQNGWAVHDAMTLFLPLMSLALFQWLLKQSSKRHLLLANLSMWIYLLHPWLIVIVRGMASLSGLLILKENALILYLLTVVGSLGAGWLIERGRRIDGQKQKLDRN